VEVARFLHRVKVRDIEEGKGKSWSFRMDTNEPLWIYNQRKLFGFAQRATTGK
jgi:hypothetical protein